ncbi:hypothetical protein WJX64_07510 [Leifsonia sp. YIM 134122]|uniref:DUF3558 domain-containing protein n=1 Tax=Leifsonia stereocauli TaxID=3134136 RepID=A0ABU9W334_9MICO
MKSLVAGVAAALLVGTLAGCAPSAESSVPTATAAAPAPRPTPITAAPAVSVPAMPRAAFKADCTVVATDAEVSDAIGGPVVAEPYSGDVMPDWMVQSLGGIRCAWTPADGIGAWVTVIPVAAAGQDIVDDAGDGEPACYGGEFDAGYQDACSFSTTVGEWWYAGVVYTAPDSGIDATDAIDELVADLGTRAAAHAAEVPANLDGAWTDTPDCDALDESVDTTPIGLDLEAVVGNQPEEAGPGFWGAVAATGEQTCYWEESDGVALATTEILPGGWWVIDRQSQDTGAAPVAIDGALRALRVPDADGSASETLYVTDGVNLVTARGTLDAEQLGALAVLVMNGVAG